MKLDRNIPANRARGKYAILKLRNIDAPRDVSHYANYQSRIEEALKLLEEVGILDWGEAGTEAEFFLIRLKDMFAADALWAYAEAAKQFDPEYAQEIFELATRSGGNSPFCKLPDCARRIVRLHNEDLIARRTKFDGLATSTGIELIEVERARQIGVEGWTEEHDSQHDMGELPAAAMCYAVQAVSEEIRSVDGTDFVREWWPWDDEWWKPTIDPIRNLVKAGALIAAEIDRRLAAKGQDGTGSGKEQG